MCEKQWKHNMKYGRKDAMAFCGSEWNSSDAESCTDDLWVSDGERKIPGMREGKIITWGYS